MLPLEQGALRDLHRRCGIELEWTERSGQCAEAVAAAVADWWLDEATVDRVVLAAAAEAADGAASPTRRALAARAGNAGQVPPEELRGLISDLMVELGYADSYQGGVALFCGLYRDRIARGATHPYLGAASLRWAGLHAAADPSGTIDVFGALAERWLTEPKGRSVIERQIVDEATARAERPV